MHGMDNFAQQSRFIAEIPEEFVEEMRPRAGQPADAIAPSRAAIRRRLRRRAGVGVRLGQRVRHQKFGDGVILNCEGQGAHARVEVNFETRAQNGWFWVMPTLI